MMSMNFFSPNSAFKPYKPEEESLYKHYNDDIGLDAIENDAENSCPELFQSLDDIDITAIEEDAENSLSELFQSFQEMTLSEEETKHRTEVGKQALEKIKDNCTIPAIQNIANEITSGKTYDETTALVQLLCDIRLYGTRHYISEQSQAEYLKDHQQTFTSLLNVTLSIANTLVNTFMKLQAISSKCDTFLNTIDEHIDLLYDGKIKADFNGVYDHINNYKKKTEQRLDTLIESLNKSLAKLQSNLNDKTIKAWVVNKESQLTAHANKFKQQLKVETSDLLLEFGKACNYATESKQDLENNPSILNSPAKQPLVKRTKVSDQEAKSLDNNTAPVLKI